MPFPIVRVQLSKGPPAGHFLVTEQESDQRSQLRGVRSGFLASIRRNQCAIAPGNRKLVKRCAVQQPPLRTPPVSPTITRTLSHTACQPDKAKASPIPNSGIPQNGHGKIQPPLPYQRTELRIFSLRPISQETNR